MLDEYQLQAVKYIGNLLLIAPAGSGKSFTIINKINYLIENNYCKDREILVLSFTNKSVNDLVKKIKYNVDIKTFHKLAMQILDDYNLNYQISSSTTLSYLIKEFFYSLNDSNLKEELVKYFKVIDYDKFLSSNKFKEFTKLIENFIKLYKTNNKGINDLKIVYQENNLLTKYILIIMKIYQEELKSSNLYDFDDLIIKATHVLNKYYKYKYILIDEFQDTSLIRFNLVNKIRILNNAYLFAVGDDYQSIYHFSGCSLNLFLSFNKLIPNSKIMYLKYTYRNSQELINIANKFILKNKYQIKKDILSKKHLDKPIEFIYYLNPYKAFKKIYNKLKDTSLLVLGRNNFDIKKFSKDKINEYMTIHSAKGLESDNVIIINLIDDTYGIPNKLKNNKLIELINESDKSYINAEERRLFYVALTRTKNKVYLLVPLFHQSSFIKELKKNKTN